MYQELIHLYGPISIHSYGLCICIGLIIYIFATKRLLIPQFIDEDLYVSLLLLGIAAGIIGGRLFYICCNPHFSTQWIDALVPWYGGFSILGSIIVIGCSVIGYLKKHALPILPILDHCVLFAPLLQSISRIGCFLSGCCWGIPSHSWLSVIYTQPGPWPSDIPLHPTQLYSSFALLVIFFYLFTRSKQFFKQKGRMLCTYIFMVSCERFFVDFWRGEREFFDIQNTFLNILSITQWIALSLMIVAVGVYLYIKQSTYESVYPH